MPVEYMKCNFILIHFYFDQPLYYILNILLPCVMLSMLILLVFCMPPDGGEKVSLSITVLLSFTVFMLMVSDNMPQTSNHTPTLGNRSNCCEMSSLFSCDNYTSK